MRCAKPQTNSQTNTHTHAITETDTQPKWRQARQSTNRSPNWPGRDTIDVAQGKQDAASPDITKILAQDAADIQALNVRQTSTFFVNGRPLKQFGLTELKALVDAGVKAKYGS